MFLLSYLSLVLFFLFFLIIGDLFLFFRGNYVSCAYTICHIISGYQISDQVDYMLLL